MSGAGQEPPEMTPRQKLRARRWNERVRLVTTFLNITAVGTFGLAVTSPLLEHLRLVNGQSTASPLGWNHLALDQNLAWYEYVYWPFALGALILHVMAHILVGVIDPEE